MTERLENICRTVQNLFFCSVTASSQQLPQLTIDWEDSSADAHFCLERTPAYQRNTTLLPKA
jgi:hypothetical protein